MAVQELLLVYGLAWIDERYYKRHKCEAWQLLEWFIHPENKELLAETIKQCRNNPGELKDTPNCINAQEAKRRRWGQYAIYCNFHLSDKNGK